MTSAAPDLLRRAWVLPAATGAVLLTLFLSTLTSANSYDAVAFSLYVETAAGRGEAFLELFHPYHVQHMPLAVLLLLGLHAAGAPAGGLVVMQVMASVAGACLGAGLVAVLRPRAGALVAVATTAGCMLAAGTWFYAVDAENNLLGLAFAVAALGPSAALLRDDEPAPWRRAGALLGLAGAFHILTGALWIALLGLGALRGRGGLRRVVPALALATAVLATAYVPRAALLQHEKPGWRLDEIVHFTEHTLDDQYLLVHPFDPVAEVRGMLAGVAPEAPLAPLGRALPLAWLAVALVAALRRRLGPEGLLAGGWFLVILAVLSAWSEADFEFTAFLLVPLAVAGGCGLGGLVPSQAGRGGIAAAGLVLAAAVGHSAWTATVEPGLDPARNALRVRAERIGEATAPEDVVLASAAGGHLLKVYVPYFAHRRTVIPDLNFGTDIDTSESLRRLRRRVESACAHGGRLHAVAELVEPWSGGRLPFDHEAVRAMLLELGPEPALRDPESGRVLLYRFRECPRHPADAGPSSR